MPPAPLTINDKGEVPISRIPDAGKCRELFIKAWEADERSSQNRNAVQKQIDGHPPFNTYELKKMGLGSASNLNFGEAQADMDRAIAAYNDMLTSQERMAFVALSSDYSTPTTRGDWSDKIAIAYHKVNTEWDEYYFEQQMLAWYFNRDGLGIYIYPDDRDPRWRAESLDGFKIPRGTKATENKVEYAFARHYLQVHELYGFIKDEKFAKDLGWNVEVAQDAIANAYSERQGEKWSWSRVETMLKNNDYYSTSARASEIKAWDCFVREFDGKYSHHIFLAEGSEEYLFTKVSRYPKATAAFIISTYGIGTNGCYHGIRGLGYRIFPFCEHSNRLRNKILDGAAASTALMFEADDASQAQKAGMAYIGSFAILPSGLKLVQATMPNPALTALPVIADLASTRLSNTGGFMSVGAGGTVERKELDIQNEMANQAVLPSSSINLFMIARQKMMKEQLRRLSLKAWAPNEGGKEMAEQFQKYLKEMDVPVEALDHIQNIVPARALGAGSPSARQLAFQKLSELMPEMDEVGRNNLIRDMVGSDVGFDQVDRYVPQLENRQRPVIDEKIAELENGNLKQGIQVMILDGEDDATHLKVHVRALVITAHQVQGSANIPATIQFFSVGIPHAQEHMERLAQDASRAGMLQGFKPVLAGLNQLAQQLVQAVQKQQVAGGPSPNGSGGGPQAPSEMEIKIQAAQAQIQLAVQESQNKMQIKNQEALQRMQIRDAREAQSIRIKTANQQVSQEIAQ